MFQGDASYEFGYDIHNPLSNDIKSHHEVRDGKNVLGYYTFKEADGSIRMVKYKVTPETGFEAVVEKLPDPLAGNSIDGQEAAPSTHGAPETANEPNGGANSQYVAGTGGLHNIVSNRNPRANVPAQPIQNYNNRNPPVQDQRPGGGYANPHIIRRNPPVKNDQAAFVNGGQYPLHADTPRFAQATTFVDFPRGRPRNPHLAHQLSLQDRGQPRIAQDSRRNQFIAPQAQYVNNPVQPNPYPSGKIVYIDGVAYIDDIGLYSDPEDQNGGNGQQQVQDPQYQVVENPENNANNEAATETSEETETDEEKEDFVEDEEDEDLANFEEEDEDEDENVEASDFYEDNEQFINEQQAAYARLKKAYEEEDQEPKPKEEEVQEQQPEPVQEQQ